MMSIYPLVFSNNSKYRISRHIIFWLALLGYYTAFMTISWMEKYPFATSFPASLLEETFALPLDMVFCYAVVYYLIPKFLFNGRYIVMVLLWIILSLLCIACYRLYGDHIVPIIRSAYRLPYSVHSKSFLWTFFYLFT